MILSVSIWVIAARTTTSLLTNIFLELTKIIDQVDVVANRYSEARVALLDTVFTSRGHRELTRSGYSFRNET